MKYLLKHIFFFLLLISLGCQDNSEKTASGKFLLVTDESFLPFIQSENKVYAVNNKDITPVIVPLPEEEGFQKFLKDTTEAIVASRMLLPQESALLAQRNIFPPQYKIASDAVVFLNSLQRKDSILLQSGIQNILIGKLTNWKELGGEEGEIQLVFSGNHSVDLLFLIDSINIPVNAKIYTAGSTEKVVDYVATHPNAIGVIGLSWISDDPKTNPWMKKVRALWVQDEKGKARHPFQENLVHSKYPYKRDIYYITKFKSGLGINFVSFILGDAGQRLALKFGLLPAEMPGREVHMHY